MNADEARDLGAGGTRGLVLAAPIVAVFWLLVVLLLVVVL